MIQSDTLIDHYRAKPLKLLVNSFPIEGHAAMMISIQIEKGPFGGSLGYENEGFFAIRFLFFRDTSHTIKSLACNLVNQWMIASMTISWCACDVERSQRLDVALILLYRIG
jgi:hypothetical protein